MLLADVESRGLLRRGDISFPDEKRGVNLPFLSEFEDEPPMLDLMSSTFGKRPLSSAPDVMPRGEYREKQGGIRHPVRLGMK